jgi:hypothetical protein
MKSIVYSIVAIFTFVCFALAQQAPDSVAYDSNPSSLQLRAQTGTNNTALLTWMSDPTSPGFIIWQNNTMIAVVGPFASRFQVKLRASLNS